MRLDCLTLILLSKEASLIALVKLSLVMAVPPEEAAIVIASRAIAFAKLASTFSLDRRNVLFVSRGLVVF